MKKVLLLAILISASAAQPTTSLIKPNQNALYYGNVKKDFPKFFADCLAYGFAIDDQWFPCWMPDACENSFEYQKYEDTQKGELQFVTEVENVLLVNAEHDGVYAFAYRVVVTPLQPGRDWGFMGIGSHGDNWYFKDLTTTIQLQGSAHLTNWSLKNVPLQETQTISCGYGVGAEVGSDGASASAEVSMSASVTYDVSELVHEDHTKAGINKYESFYRMNRYDYDLKNSVYAKYSSEYYGFIVFTSPDFDWWLDVSHKVTYYGSEYHGNTTKTYDFCY